MHGDITRAMTLQSSMAVMWYGMYQRAKTWLTPDYGQGISPLVRDSKRLNKVRPWLEARGLIHFSMPCVSCQLAFLEGARHMRIALLQSDVVWRSFRGRTCWELIFGLTIWWDEPILSIRCQRIGRLTKTCFLQI